MAGSVSEGRDGRCAVRRGWCVWLELWLARTGRWLGVPVDCVSGHACRNPVFQLPLGSDCQSFKYHEMASTLRAVPMGTSAVPGRSFIRFGSVILQFLPENQNSCIWLGCLPSTVGHQQMGCGITVEYQPTTLVCRDVRMIGCFNTREGPGSSVDLH